MYLGGPTGVGRLRHSAHHAGGECGRAAGTSKIQDRSRVKEDCQRSACTERSNCGRPSLSRRTELRGVSGEPASRPSGPTDGRDLTGHRDVVRFLEWG